MHRRFIHPDDRTLAKRMVAINVAAYTALMLAIAAFAYVTSTSVDDRVVQAPTAATGLAGTVLP